MIKRETIKDDFNSRKNCIFAAKRYLIFKSFKCDLTLEKEDDFLFKEMFEEFN